MRRNSYQNFLDDEVLSASPVKLVQLLYNGALDAIRSARRHLRQGEIRPRSQAISKAMVIVSELTLSLDRRAGGELSANLADLYQYVQKLLIEANTTQTDPPLATAERLLTTLSEAWCTAVKDQPSEPARATEVGPPHEPRGSLSCAY